MPARTAVREAHTLLKSFTLLILGKTAKLGVHIPAGVKEFLERVETEVKRAVR
ncbi:hypothetical protein KNP414_01800 [Paenibacillus mucilaginosus KNP414]|uniref:Uncharacterized protein n=1 Tax=Paenibacillus mucilaginosus (strain KNP414) TaxID=1036673 RepID=F8FQK7_PAEMK|nr:hypothetical protein KNP414_01800 [Paenibacillus mucilaginosus KNP414]